MKHTSFFLSIGLLFSTIAFAGENCFLAKENHQVIKQEGKCDIGHSPCSTFKIALSLMGYNEGILIDETHPEWQFKEGYTALIDTWKQPHNPRLWMKNSCVWYSRVLTEKLEMSKLRDYVKKFKYGNEDLSGDKGKDNGLTNAWLSSSLEISPEEQIIFLQKLLDNKLPVSVKSHEMTRNILYLEDLPDGWKLYGKTGSGNQLSPDRTKKLDLQIGWFIGWIQKDDRTIIFANFIQDDEKEETYASLRAKSAAKEKLLQLVEDIED